MQLDLLSQSLGIPYPPAAVPYIRTSVTSLEAAEAIEPKVGTLRRSVLEFLRKRGSHGATDEEIQRGLGMNPSTERPRRIELHASGFITESTHTRKTASGRNASVWVCRD